MTTVYGGSPSGNGHKLRGVDVEIAQGQSRTPGHLAKHTNGRVPPLEPDDGRILTESSAITWFLAALRPE